MGACKTVSIGSLRIIYLKSHIQPKTDYQNPNNQQRYFQPSVLLQTSVNLLVTTVPTENKKGLPPQIAQPPLFSIETNGIKGYTIKQLLGIHPNNHEAIRVHLSFCFRGLRADTRIPPPNSRNILDQKV